MNEDYNPFFDFAFPLNFRDLVLSPNLKVLVLAPHPDDFDSIGITMRLLKENGNSIYLSVLTSGISGVEDRYAAKINIKDKALIRREEQLESCKFFGMPKERINFLQLELDKEGHLIESPHNITSLKYYWDSIMPDLVFLPHGNDTNKDHQQTYKLFSKLAEMEFRKFAALLNYDPKTINMRYDIYSTFIDTDAEWKGRLLRFHKSQHERNIKSRGHGFDERILAINRLLGHKLGSYDYAEAFELELYGADIITK